MTRPISEDRFHAFVKEESVFVTDLICNTDLDDRLIYRHVVSLLNDYCASCLDTDEMRDILSQDPEMTEKSHTLAGMFFAQAASELQIVLIENSPTPTGERIGSIISGIELGIEISRDGLPAILSVAQRLALYRALPKDVRDAFKKELHSKMELT